MEIPSGPGSGAPGSDPVSLLQEVKQYYEDYQQMKQEQREAEAEQEVAPRKNNNQFSSCQFAFRVISNQSVIADPSS